MNPTEKITNAIEFEPYQEAIDALGSEKNIACTPELLEGVLSVFAYHKTRKHKAVQESAQGLAGELTPLYYSNLSDDMDWFTKGQLKGLIHFMESFAEGQRPLDLSHFFLASGFDYQIGKSACEAYFEYVRNEAYDAVFQKLTYLVSVFDALWKLKMDSRRILGNIANWDEDLIKTTIAFLERHPETEFDVLVGLSMNDFPDQRQLLVAEIILPQLAILKKRRDKLNRSKKNIDDSDLQSTMEYEAKAIGELVRRIKDWYPEIKQMKK